MKEVKSKVDMLCEKFSAIEIEMEYEKSEEFFYTFEDLVITIETAIQKEMFSELKIFLKLLLKRLDECEIPILENIKFQEYFFGLTKRHGFLYEVIQNYLNFDSFRFDFTDKYRKEVIMNIEKETFVEADKFDNCLFFTSENWLTNLLRVSNDTLTNKYKPIYEQDEENLGKTNV